MPSEPIGDNERGAADARQEADRRASVIERRAGSDRRTDAATTVESERRAGSRRDDTGLERRRGPGRRLADDRRSAEEGEMNPEQFEFVMAIEAYKKVNRRLYPTWTEVLEVIGQLGYRKVESRTVTLNEVPEPPLRKVA